MKNLKSEKGAITIVVLATMLFLLSFLMSSYMIVTNKAKKQKELSNEIQEMYKNHDNLNEIYNSYINNDIIPIYTVEQLLKIGSEEYLVIDNKYCKMTLNAIYALMNDLSFDVLKDEALTILEGANWTPVNSNPEFKGAFIGNGYEIEVITNSGETKTYSQINNYSD